MAQNNPYVVETPQQQQQQMPQMPMGLMNMFGGQGSGFMGVGGAPAATPAAPAGATAAGGGAGAAGGSAGSGMASGLSAAGPWALLAAVIIANESEAKKAGRRSDDHGEHAQDLFTGKVLEQDMDYYSDKVGGPGGEILQGLGRMGHPEGVFNVLKSGIKKIF